MHFNFVFEYIVKYRQVVAAKINYLKLLIYILKAFRCLSVRAMDLIFSRRVAEAFGAMQIVMGAAFIALSLASIYWKFEISIAFSLVSEWFSFFVSSMNDIIK